MFKKLKELIGIYPRREASHHEKNENIRGILDTAFGRRVDPVSSFKAQGFVHGVVAYFAAFDSTRDQGIARADSDLKAFYRENYPNAWKAIVDGISTAKNSPDYREGIRLGFAEMEVAARCMAPDGHVSYKSYSLLVAKGLIKPVIRSRPMDIKRYHQPAVMLKPGNPYIF